MNEFKEDFIKVIDEKLSLNITEIAIKKQNTNVTYGVIGLRKELTNRIVQDMFDISDYKRCKEKGLWYKTKGIMMKKESNRLNYKELMKDMYYFVFMYMFCDVLIFNIAYYVSIYLQYNLF